jgi:DNA replication licensing factor MCM7
LYDQAYASTEKIQTFLSTFVGTNKEWDEDFADIALSDDEDDTNRKGLKYMQQLVRVTRQSGRVFTQGLIQ